MDNLRQALPRDWTLQREREPVFGSDILVVQAGQQHSQTVLLVHGLGQNGFTDWISVITQLAKQYHVLALDFPGFGYSDSPTGKYSPGNYARILNAILARHTKGPAIVVGHSLGGAVALRFAGDYPQQLTKLILIDAAGILQRTAFVKFSTRVPLSVETMPSFLKNPVALLKDFGHSAIESVLSMPDPTRILNTSETLWGAVLGKRSNANAGMALVEEDFSTLIPRLQTPTWILWGDADPIAPLRTAHMLAYRVPNAQLIIMPGLGHTPMEPATVQTFVPKLMQAISTQPKAQLRKNAPEVVTASLVCRNETDRLYSGDFDEVFIENCNAVRLENLSARRVVIRDSIVQMLNVSIDSSNSKGAAIDISNSELLATAGEIKGEIGIRADKARIDLAGVVLNTRSHAIEVQRFSRIIGSVSEIISPAYTGPWQGSAELEAGVLAP